MIFLYPKAFKKSKTVSILENDRKGFVTLSDHCAMVHYSFVFYIFYKIKFLFAQVYDLKYLSKSCFLYFSPLRGTVNRSCLKIWQEHFFWKIFFIWSKATVRNNVSCWRQNNQVYNFVRNLHVVKISMFLHFAINFLWPYQTLTISWNSTSFHISWISFNGTGGTDG